MNVIFHKTSEIQCFENCLQEKQGAGSAATHGLASEAAAAADVANIQDESGYFHLDVHHPDSPYGLIQDVLKPSHHRNSPQIAFFGGGGLTSNNNNQVDLGGLDSNEVWLSQGDLLVLKGDVIRHVSVTTFSSKMTL